MVRNWIKSQPAHVVLIAINVAVFVLQQLLKILGGLFLMPIDIVTTLFSLESYPADFILKPWGLFTYMFVHVGNNFWHLAGNMLFLFFLGKIFESHFGRRTMFQMYIIGGLFAGLVFFVAYQIFPFFQAQGYRPLVGASGAVYAIVTGICIARPKQEVALFGVLRIPLIALLIVFILKDLPDFFTANAGGNMTHLGGAIFGIWFALKMNKGVNILLPVTRFFDKFRFTNRKKNKSTMKVVYNKKVKSMDDAEYNYIQKANDEKLNAILDKISKSGYDSLSKSEKDFLNFMSEQNK